MSKSLFSILVLLFSLNANAFSKANVLVCDGIVQTIVDDKLVEEKIALEKVLDDPATVKMEGEIGDHFFSVQGSKKSNSYLIMITFGPDYVSGVTASLTWDQKNQMRLAHVNKYDVAKVNCHK